MDEMMVICLSFSNSSHNFLSHHPPSHNLPSSSPKPGNMIVHAGGKASGFKNRAEDDSYDTGEW